MIDVKKVRRLIVTATDLRQPAQPGRTWWRVRLECGHEKIVVGRHATNKPPVTTYCPGCLWWYCDVCLDETLNHREADAWRCQSCQTRN